MSFPQLSSRIEASPFWLQRDFLWDFLLLTLCTDIWSWENPSGKGQSSERPPGPAGPPQPSSLCWGFGNCSKGSQHIQLLNIPGSVPGQGLEQPGTAQVSLPVAGVG